MGRSACTLVPHPMLPLVLVLATAALDVPVTSPSSVHEERLARLLTALERDANFEPSFAAPTLGLGLGLTVFGSVLTAALGGGTLALFWAALGCAPFALIWLVGEIVGFAVTASDRASARQRTAQLSDEASEVAALLPDGVERLAAWRDSRPERRGPPSRPPWCCSWWACWPWPPGRWRSSRSGAWGARRSLGW